MTEKHIESCPIFCPTEVLNFNVVNLSAFFFWLLHLSLKKRLKKDRLPCSLIEIVYVFLVIFNFVLKVQVLIVVHSLKPR